ncbi:MAG TPA: Gfo/Idh/MocA family oxidoreductase, partial [Candidatus Bathyarchaeota archaeon]|nr:Gfo/Idh/MocA family oxidoreductase [Candidatus Bathyarchaeota archaeon]
MFIEKISRLVVVVKRVGAGLIGAGFAANIHANAYKRLPNVDVVAVYSRTAERAKKFAEDHGLKAWYTDMDELLEREDIDIVSIAIPNYLHAKAALKAIEHGKNVIVEKPLTTTIEDADKLIEAAKREGVKLMYAENMLFSPAMRRAREIIEEGAIGDILVVEARESHSGSHSPYALKKEYCGGGSLMNLGVHPIGVAL